MSGGQWRWRDNGVAPLDIPVEVLVQFQNAAKLRDMMFSAGGVRPSLRFDLTPISVDPGLSHVQLDIDGGSVQSAQAVAIMLPSGNGSGQVRFSADPALRVPLGTDGPWAWWRMMDKGSLLATAQGERYRLSFVLDGHRVTYQLDASSAVNPFKRKELEQFRCPVKL